MKNLWMVLLIVAITAIGCQTDTTPKIPKIMSITNNRIELNDGTSLELANVPGGQSTIFLIRHAVKESKEIDAPLSQIGFEQARRIDSLFQNVDLKGVLCTSFKRSIQTAGPISDSKQIPVMNYDVDNTAPVYPFITEYEKGHKFLMIGHSNTIPLIAKEMVDSTISNIPETDYDDILVLTLKDKGEGTLFHYKY